MIVLTEITSREFMKSNLLRQSLEGKIMLFLAWLVAGLAHLGQRRRSGRRYIKHPMVVAALLARACLEAQIAALLHDVFEETNGFVQKIFVRTIRYLFGEDGFEGVFGLTNWWRDDGKYYAAMSLAIVKRPYLLLVKVADKLHVVAEPYHKSPEDERAYLMKVMEGFYCFALAHRHYLSWPDQLIFNEMMVLLVNRVKARLVEISP